MRSARSMTPWALFLALILICAPSEASAAASSSSSPRAASLSVEFEGIEASLAERLTGEIEAELRAELEHRGVSIGGERGPAIEVHIALVDPTMLDYAITIDVVGAERRERVIENLTCETCSERRLEDEVLLNGPRLVEALNRLALAPEPASAPEDDAPEPVESPASPVPASPIPGSRLGPLGLAGVSALTAGAVSTAFGALVLGDVLRSGPESMSRYGPYIDVQTKGALIVGVSAGVAALGITALILDQTALAARRQRRLDLSLGLSREHACVWLKGEF